MTRWYDGPVRRVGDGSSVVARRIGAALVPAGRPGAAVLRVGGAVLAAPAVVNSLHQQPSTTAVPAVAWLWAAWKADGPATEDTVPADPAEPIPARPDTPDDELTAGQFLAVLHRLVGTGSGVHLAQVAEHLTGDSSATGRVRALCAAAGVPVARGVRVPGRAVSTGVRRADLPPAPTVLSGPPSVGSVAVVAAGHPGQQQSGRQQQQDLGEGPQKGISITPHPDGHPNHWTVNHHH